MAGAADPQQAIRAGLAALQAGDAARAAPLLREAAGALPADQVPWLALGNAEFMLGRNDAAEAAIDRQLALAMRDVGALLFKGLLRERGGDTRAASSFFQAAVNQAAVTGCPPPFADLLAYAGRAITSAQDRYAEHLHAVVGATVSPTMRTALDMLMGRTEPYLQQPTMFYYPFLPQKWFYDPRDFPWLDDMLDLLPQMQAELAAVEDAAFSPYVVTIPGRPSPNNPLLDDPAWGAFYFWRNGTQVETAMARCPATMAALELAPMPRIPGRAPGALWSRLKPGAHIAPHVGMLNTRLICHIPIRPAPNCTLRVGGETRTWEPGVPLVFDDSVEHEARNDGPEERVVLLFEIWRPEIPAEDRDTLLRLFQAIEAFDVN
ncbi:aspartyl/asparaginyl beta-hydroxylase domain-containing protein [Novosphingobium piscinae]|uniref:Aspartyl/asparaginyl beta-hydroxylase domain-containing protein n=1 Tax=Novosphingobium piscinae TaxID=1507448 RepID=A0A7X1FZW2_9SPHN|nr:aspartyl/asparaginyl beta-hydroxylase domain-containing protein [Novosphingobium piscinae]MBC2670060.1 aspartyl/asparaginyl beta-hydroxylase domain-containing protein [Novosphingobium piscinae]